MQWEGKEAGGVKVAGPAWDALHRGLGVAVLGAGRSIGRELCAEILRAGHPVGLLGLHGKRRAGFTWRGETLRVKGFDGLRGDLNLAFVCTDRGLAAQLIPRLIDREIRVVDLSGFAAESMEVPLAADGISEEGLGLFTQAVAVAPHCLMGLLRVLGPLDAAARLLSVEVTSILGAAHGGGRGMRALREERADPVQMGGQESSRIGNLRPLAEEELGEFRPAALCRFLGRSDLPVHLEALRGDAERTDLHLVRVDLAEEMDLGAAAGLLGAIPGVRVEEGPLGPVPLRVQGSRRVHLGRIRTGSRGSRSLCFSAVADPLRLGAATALRVAGRLSAVR